MCILPGDGPSVGPVRPPGATKSAQIFIKIYNKISYVGGYDGGGCGCNGPCAYTNIWNTLKSFLRN